MKSNSTGNNGKRNGKHYGLYVFFILWRYICKYFCIFGIELYTKEKEKKTVRIPFTYYAYLDTVSKH